MIPAVELADRTGRCRDCGNEVVWATTDHGRKMPMHPVPLDTPFRTWRLYLDGSDLRVSWWEGQGQIWATHFDLCPARVSVQTFVGLMVDAPAVAGIVASLAGGGAGLRVLKPLALS